MFKVGDKIKTNVAWYQVPKGTTGVVVEDYGSGLMIRWDLPYNWKPLEDGFNKDNGELDTLEKVK